MRLSSYALATTLAATPAATVGCAGNVAGSGGDAEAGTTTGAMVVVERAADGTEGSRAEGSARFVRVSAPTSLSDALRVIGAELELPAHGSCATLASLGGGDAAADTVPVVQLMDVGAVSLEAGGARMRLLPRRLPDITDVVSGVVYDRAAEAALFPASSSYVVHVAGGPDLAAFDFTASAPGDPSDNHLTGEDAQGPLVASGPSVELTWTPERPDDVVYVEVRPNGVRCVFDDVGHGSVSTVFFDDAGTLVVHRLHREPLRAPGIDAGEIRFDFARTIAYVRR